MEMLGTNPLILFKSDTHMDKKMMIYSGTLVILAIFSLSFDTIESILYKSMNIFIEGYSPIRVYITLGWMAFLFLLGSLSWRGDFRRFGSRFVLGSMMMVFIIGLSTQIWFNQKFDIESRDLALVVNDGEMTGTALTHNHLSKSFFGFIIYPIAPSFESLDLGTGADSFIPILPRILFIISFTTFLISLVFCFIGRLKNIERGKNMFIAGFGLLTGLIVIRTIDGGILSANTLLFIGLLYAVLSARGARNFWCISFGALIIQLGWYLMFSDFITSTIDDIRPYLFTAFVAWCAILLLVGSTYISNHKARVTFIYILSSLCVLLMLVYMFSIMRVEVNTEISTETAYIATYKTAGDPAYVRLGDINMLMIYKYNGVSKKVSELIYDQYTLARFDPVSVPGRTCNAHDVAHISTFRLLSVEPVSNMQKPEIGLSLVFRPMESPLAGMFAYRAVLISPSCLPRHLSVLQESVTATGAKHFIISERR
jgi:hypothetical protein